MLELICTVEDAAGFGYDVDETFLARASSRIRTYTRQQVTVGNSTALLPGAGPWLLPQRPVRSVTAVVDADEQPVEYRLKGQLLYAHDPKRPHRVIEDVTASWEHGFDTMPDGLLEVCAQIAYRLGSTPKELEQGMQQETVGGITRGFGSWAAGAVAELMPSEKLAIDRFLPRRPRTIQLAP